MSSVDLCAHAAELSRSDALKIVQSIKCFLCVAGSVTSVTVLWKGGLSWLGFRPLTRSIFIGHVVSALVCSILFTTCYAYDIYRLSQRHENPCDFTLDMQFAFLARIFPVFGLFGSIYFMVCLAVERSLATLWPVVYDRISRGKIFSFFAVVFVILISVSIPLAFLLPPVNWTRRLAVFNTKTEENAQLFQIMVWFEIIPGLAALILFHSALYVNHRRDAEKTVKYLDMRVLIESNKRVIHIVLPVLWTHFVFNAFTSFGLQLYPLIDPHPSLVALSVALECCNVIQVYPAALSLILLYKLLLRPLQLPRAQISSVLEQNLHNSKAFHFEQLRGYFDDGQDYGKPRWFSGICC